MSRPLRVLIIEDHEDDMLLLLRELQRGGYDPIYERVETAPAMQAALAEQRWEVIIADYSLPHFNAPAALALLQASGLDLPFIIVSGTVGEETAVAAMKAGADDYLMKGQFARLIPAIEREMREVEVRRERKLAEKELRLVNDLIEQTTQPIAVGDLEGRVIRFNRAFEQLTGYEGAELSQLTFQQLTSERWQAMEEQWTSELIATGQAVHYEKEYRRKDGVLVPVEGVLELYRNAEGEPKYIYGFDTDITARKQMETALAEERNLLRTLIDHLPDSIYVKDTQGRHLLVNHAAERGVDVVTMEDMLGKTDLDLYPPEVAQKWFADDMAVIQSGRPLINREEFSLDETGGLRWDLTTKVPLSDNQGNVVGLVGITRDITERKQFEETLAKERNLFRTVIDNLPDLIYVKDLESRFVLVNQASLQMGQQAMADIIGKTDFEINPPELAAQYYADDQAVIQSGQAIIDREEGNTSTGQMRWFSTTKVPLRDSQGQIIGLVGLSRDITERKQAEAALQESMAFNQTVLNSLKANIAVLDSQGVIKTVNNAWEEFARDNGDPTLARTGPGVNYLDVCRQATGPEASLAQAALAGIQAVMSGTDSHFSLEYDCHSPNEQRWFMMRVTPLRNGRENVVVAHEYITERKRAEIELEQRAVQLDLINHIGAQITAVLELDRLLDQTAFLVHHTFNYHHVAIFFIEAGMLHLKAVAGLYRPYFPVGHTQHLDQGIMGWVANSSVKIVVNDVGQDPHYVSLIAAHSITRSELCIPLIIAGQTIGVLDLQSPHLNGFGQNDITTMDALAYQLAGAIANARLYEQARQEINERQRVEAEISARNRELILLNQIIAASSGNQEIEVILETTCSELARAFNMSQVTAILLNGEKSELVVVARYGATETGLPEIQNGEWLTAQGERIPVDRHHALGRYLLNHSGPLVASEAQNDPRLTSIRETLQRRGIVSLLLLPLLVEGETLGSLNLEATEPHPFSKEEVTLAWSVADQVAGALSRIRLEQERAATEAEVRASEERFRQVVASVSDHIYMSEITAEGHHFNRYISPNIEELTGYLLEKFVNDATFWPTVVIHPDDQAIAAGQLTRLRRGENSEVEYRMVQADGQIIWVRDNGRVVPQAGSLLIYGVVSDVTERKRIEMALLDERARLAERVAERTAELSAANAQLARAAQLKDEFLASMSHELRTPLNAILGMSEILRENIYGRLNEEQLNAVGYIEEGGRHLLMLINDILDLSKIEAGKLELIITPVSVEGVCQASLRFIKQTAQKKQLSVSFALDSTISTIQADERRLKQILVNLLTNAVKFTPEGGQVKLEVVHDPASETLCFKVHDTGIGIAPHDMERLFKPFVQLDSKLSRQHEGTGLGLALVSRLTELHGGGVKVESRLDQGSKFTVSLPYQVEANPAELPAIPLEFTSGSSRPLQLQRVLIVEDSPAAAEQLVHYLAEEKIETLVQSTGAEAIAQALSWQPQVIILDLMLPDLSGWEVLAHLKANPLTQNIPVLIMSVVDEHSHGLKLGAADYLVKPISRTQLWQTLQRIPLFQETPDSKKPLILLAEDNEANINTLSPYLQAKGYRLKLARNGSQAVEMAQEERPDVILMDIQMPVMDGLEAIRRLRADPQFAHVPIIALTALAMPGDRERCLAAGANEYLSKPVSLKGLVELIEQMMKDR